MDVVLIAAAIAIALVVVVVLAGRGRFTSGARGRSPRRPRQPLPEPITTIALDIAPPDPGSEHVERLVRQAALDLLSREAIVEVVVVTDRDGRELGRIVRPEEPPLPREATPIAPQLRPRPAHPTRKHPHPDRTEVAAADEPSTAVLADRFDLSPRVREVLADADDATAIVHAILEAGGREVDADGQLLRTGDHAVVVIAPDGHAVRHAQLNQAFLRYQATHARQGLVVCLGYVDPAEVRRRELLAPELVHVGPDAIQRMADAVAVGADPLAFARSPALSG